jgi:hypothetical protein
VQLDHFHFQPRRIADAPGLNFSRGLFGAFADDRRFPHIG